MSGLYLTHRTYGERSGDLLFLLGKILLLIDSGGLISLFDSLWMC